jgi:hypothetical protein
MRVERHLADCNWGLIAVHGGLPRDRSANRNGHGGHALHFLTPSQHQFVAEKIGMKFRKVKVWPFTDGVSFIGSFFLFPHKPMSWLGQIRPGRRDEALR